MAENVSQRRLAAILAADVVGFSRLMEIDDRGTLDALKDRLTHVIEPLLIGHHGRIVKLMGDGVLAEFASAVNAVQCALDLQDAMRTANSGIADDRQIVLRIGINLGDIIVDGDDIFGDAVNVAARIQTMAEPGSVLVAGAIFDQVRAKLKINHSDLGIRKLKNIAQQISVFRVSPRSADLTASPTAGIERPPVESRASIAVLPFTNMSSDSEQNYFADGLAEDLITDLSKVKGLLVIARNSSFTYKGKAVDIRSIAKDLGVRFVVEGSVRRVLAKVRINAQLIDATDNTHLWAERYDRDLADIFTLQDEVVAEIVHALTRVLPTAATIGTRRAANLEAYDLFVRGRAMVTGSPESNRAAPQVLDQAIQLDPGFADAHAWLAMSHHFAWAYWLDPQDRHPWLALAAARRAVALDPDDAVAHAVLGDILIYARNHQEGASELATALRINPNHADAWTFLGQLSAFEGRPVEGVGHIQTALRLNPHPPGWYYWILGLAQYAAGSYDEAVTTLRHRSTHRLGSQRILAASLARLGRLDEAAAEARQFLRSYPEFSVRHWADTQPFRNESDLQLFVDGYIQAGLPH